MKLLLFALLLPTLLLAQAPPSISLAGTWRFALDADDRGIRVSPEAWQFPDTIELPGTLQAQGFGEKPSLDGPWTGHGWRHRKMFPEGQAPDNFKIPFMLQPPRLYVGAAWYQRDIEIPESWQGKHVTLHLERSTGRRAPGSTARSTGSAISAAATGASR